MCQVGNGLQLSDPRSMWIKSYSIALNHIEDTWIDKSKNREESSVIDHNPGWS